MWGEDGGLRNLTVGHLSYPVYTALEKDSGPELCLGDACLSMTHENGITAYGWLSLRGISDTCG